MRYPKQLLLVSIPLLATAAACGSDRGVLASNPSGTATPDAATDLAFLREEDSNGPAV
jgi:hypothetical protein